jgi:hypothetical protein
MTILRGLPIDGRAVTSTGVHNRIVLCEQLFGLAPPSSELKKGSIHLKWIKKTFSTPPDDCDEEVLQSYTINYD